MTIDVRDDELFWNGKKLSDVPKEDFMEAIMEALEYLAKIIKEDYGKRLH
jgi:hypothetical protein